jgi:hypothetical protein
MRPPGFDSGPVRTGPPLRASPEPVRSTVSKSARRQRACRLTGMNERAAFMNEPGQHCAGPALPLP